MSTDKGAIHNSSVAAAGRASCVVARAPATGVKKTRGTTLFSSERRSQDRPHRRKLSNHLTSFFLKRFCERGAFGALRASPPDFNRFRTHLGGPCRHSRVIAAPSIFSIRRRVFESPTTIMIGLHPVGAAPAARAGACRKGRHATWNGSGAPLAASRSGPGQRPVADASRVAALLGASRSFGRRGVRCFVLRPGETPEQARERRVKETERLMQRVIEISSAEQYESELQTNQLVVLEVDGTWDIVMDPNEPPPDYDWYAQWLPHTTNALDCLLQRFAPLYVLAALTRALPADAARTHDRLTGSWRSGHRSSARWRG